MDDALAAVVRVELARHRLVNTDRLPPEEAVAIIVAAAVGPAPP
jgi:hypothetical protein